jgi:hypothetical protein
MAGCDVPEPTLPSRRRRPEDAPRHFQEELDTGHIEASIKVPGNLLPDVTGSGGRR